MRKLSLKKNLRLLQHAGFWLSFLLIFVVIYGPVFNNFPWLFLSSVVMLPFTMALVYFINYVLLPHFLKKRQYFRLGWLIFILLLAVPPVPRIVVMHLSGEEIVFKNFLDYNLLPFYFETGLITFVAFSIKLFKVSIRERKARFELEKQKLQVELAALKSQLNSHFLFNTLNNLYGLALQGSEQTAGGILKLSDMLHFVLYECSVEYYALEKELDFIRNYVELERLRYGKRLSLELSLDPEDKKMMIAPLLLFPFVENSFKHGASKKANRVWVRLLVSTSDHEVRLGIKNNKLIDSQGKTGGGVGLKNVQKRLEILYPGKHQLQIRDEGEQFAVELRIQTQLP